MFSNAVRPARTEADREKIYQIREILDNAGFTETATLRLLGIPVFPGLRDRRRLLPEFLARAQGGGRLETFVRLFVLQQTIPINAARSAVAPTDLEGWEHIGLIRKRENEVQATVELCRCGDVIAAADWPGEAGKDVDEVMGLAASSRALIQMTIRRPTDRAFDLGTGCGVQAILAARHCQKVFAADVNPRAVRFAEFNACLNKTENIEFLTGSIFEPVAGEKFDLMICNPPFVIGPKLLYTHTSTGTQSDHFCQAIVREAPKHLSENGFAQIVCNWAQVGGETSEEHVGHWLEGSGCDAWVLHSHTEPAADYARARAEENAPDSGTADSLYDDWMKYFERENITAVNFGLITMRRSEKAANWIRYDEIPGANGVCGKSIELGFLLRDFLDAHRDDGELLNTKLRSAPDLKFLKGQGNGTHSGKTRVRLEQGLTFAATLDPEVADFIGTCKGNSTLGDYARRLAAQKHLPVTYLLPSFLVVVRHLIELGFLVPLETLSKIDQL